MFGRLKDQWNNSLAYAQEQARTHSRHLSTTDLGNADKLEEKRAERLSMAYENVRQQLVAEKKKIEQFQKMLQEKTPLSDIDDVQGFSDYMDDLSKRYSMSMDEVRRLSIELEGTKKQANEQKEASEKAIQGLQQQLEENSTSIQQLREQIDSLTQQKSELLSKTTAVSPSVVTYAPTVVQQKPRNWSKKRVSKGKSHRRAKSRPILPTDLPSLEEEVPQSNNVNGDEKKLNKDTSITQKQQDSPRGNTQTDPELVLETVGVSDDERKASYEEQIAQLKNTLKQRENEKSSIQDLLDTEREKNVAQKLASESLIKATESKLLASQKLTTELESQLTAEKQKNEQHIAAITQLQADRSSLREQINAAQAKTKELEDKLAMLETQLSEKETQIQSLHSEVGNANTLLKKQMDAASDYARKYAMIKEHNTELGCQLSELDDRLQARTEEMQEAQSMLQEQSADTRRLKETIERLESERQELRDLSRLSTMQREETSAKQFESLVRELESSNKAKEELYKEVTELRSVLDNLRTDKDVANTPPKSSSSEPSSSSRRDSSLDSAYASLRTEHENVLKALHDSMARYEHLQTSFRSVYSKYEKLKSNQTAGDTPEAQNNEQTESSTQKPRNVRKDDDMSIDKEYTRNILFQFLDQKDKRNDICTLLATLLDLDRDQQAKLLSIK
ncbi:GRIP domain-containing protein [Schizosaccharomyces japonicus yFS275]|uniref:GRIP domain-containing protein n=1 Tax=Schizosaccharomyces japonicus (strain yFS275 / FY16936) TaxID=402676 RepID=B6JXK2_SCHJY|nr:GRIP domain-containing protein [Schizosaccharomyces japonicus yFS275]EEB05146.1 GRIP domain-containing protein [Schizosaccharomyces japonicus yFS275]